jgi:hypothetical protein
MERYKSLIERAKSSYELSKAKNCLDWVENKIKGIARESNPSDLG